MEHPFDPSTTVMSKGGVPTVRDDRTEEEIQFAADNCDLWASLILIGSMSGGGCRSLPLKETVGLGRENILGAYFYCHDRRVSREHLAFEEGDGRCFVEDRQSTNGTFVNGKRVTRLALRNQDIVRAGNSLLVISDREAGVDVHQADGKMFSWHGEFGAYLEQIVRSQQQSGTVMVVGKQHSGKRALLHAARTHLAATSNIVDLHLEQSWRRGINGANRLLDTILRSLDSQGRAQAKPPTHFLQCDVGGLGPKILHRNLLPFAKRLSALGHLGIQLMLTFDTPGDEAGEEFRNEVRLLPGTREVEVPRLLRTREEIALFVGEMAYAISSEALMTVEFLEATLLRAWRHNPSYMADHVCGALERAAAGKNLAVPTDLQAPVDTAPRPAQRPTRSSLLKSLSEHDFNITAAAKANSWKLRQVHRWMATLGIELPKTGRRGARRDLED